MTLSLTLFTQSCNRRLRSLEGMCYTARNLTMKRSCGSNYAKGNGTAGEPVKGLQIDPEVTSNCVLSKCNLNEIRSSI